jgi:hypothetical protein
MNGQARPSEGRLVAGTAALVAVLAMAPITLFVVSAAGRHLQPLPNQPAAAEEHIFDWFVALPANVGGRASRRPATHRDRPCRRRPVAQLEVGRRPAG